MAESRSGQEKTERATLKRRQQAREKGNVARSIEITSVAVLALSLVGLKLFGAGMVQQIGSVLVTHFSGLLTTPLSPELVADLAVRTTGVAAAAFLPFAALVAVAGLGSNLAQTGVVLTMKPLAPQMERISPSAGLKRIFSRRAFVELVKSIVKVILVGAILAWAIRRAPAQLFPVMNLDVASGSRIMFDSMIHLGTVCAFALVLLAILDLFFQRADHEKQLMMTRQEVRDEQREFEGDPHVKAAIRSLQRERSRRRMMEDVKTADVVVTNPVHYAVALKYDPLEMSAPRVVAKGARLVAQRIREVAREAGVPVVENPTLARALFRACQVGADVPLSFYKAVAELLAFIYRDREAPVPGGAS